MAKHNEIGKIGEKIAQTFLMKQGFSVVETNYRTRYGELDIVAKKDKLHFIEVKSIKVRDFADIPNLRIRPEDNLTESKWKKFVTSVEIYLKHRHVPHETRWQIDLACVYVNQNIRQGKVKLIENILKE